MLGDAHIWVMTDGKIGDLVQCRGVARRLSTHVEERIVAPKAPWDWFSPRGPIPPADRPTQPGSPMAGPFPALVIASGRRTVPYLRAIKRANPATFTVFLKNPRIKDAAIDLIWAPVHDDISGGNVFCTDTGPHPFTQDVLDTAVERGKARFAALPAPRIGVILGGDSGAVRYDPAHAQTCATAIARGVAGHQALIVPSRRTPEALSAAVRSALPKAWYWDGSGANPYLEVLTTADQLIVTGDSHNMVSEACLSGAPLHVFRPEKLQPKLTRFLDRMEERGALKTLLDTADAFATTRIDASQEIATEIARRYQGA
jgi:mitochondrial fission protein ELM1